MKLTTWMHERSNRHDAYTSACWRSSEAIDRYDAEPSDDNLAALFAAIRAMDAAYLRFCEMDNVETEID